MSLVTLCTYRDPINAHVHRALLEAAGIPAFVSDDHVIGVQWLYSTAVGGAKLQVLSSDVDAAVEALERDESPEPSTSQASLDRTRDDDACPACGSNRVESSSLLRRSRAVSLILDFPVPVGRRRWVCGECGHSWPRHARNPGTRPETAAAEQLVRGPRGFHSLTLTLLLSWLAICIIYYVLRQPSGTLP